MKTLADQLQALSPERQAAIQARAEALIAEERTLQALRQALGLTQEEMATRLQIGQENISRLEKRGDMKLSTLQGYVEALGGELRLTVTFPDRAPIPLQGFGARQAD